MGEATRVPESQRYTLVYDGACSVCQASIEWLQRWDTTSQIQCVPYQDDEVRRQFPTFTIDALDQEIHLVSPQGDVTTGARAVEEVFRIAERAPRVSWLFRFPGGRAAARVGYRLFARNRHRFGCGDHCQLPEPTEVKRA